jgi:hypothetical protein
LGRGLEYIPQYVLLVLFETIVLNLLELQDGSTISSQGDTQYRTQKVRWEDENMHNGTGTWFSTATDSIIKNPSIKS